MIQGSLFGASPVMQRGAVLQGAYGYTLWRIWDEQLPRLLFILLNPSTANGECDDPTVRRCLGFASRASCGSLEIVNLFAYRATQPVLLKQASNPVGEENDGYILAAAMRAAVIVLGWGVHGTYLERDRAVRDLLAEYPLYVLGYTKEGHPKHPLYCAYHPLLPVPKGYERERERTF